MSNEKVDTAAILDLYLYSQDTKAVKKSGRRAFRIKSAIEKIAEGKDWEKEYTKSVIPVTPSMSAGEGMEWCAFFKNEQNPLDSGWAYFATKEEAEAYDPFVKTAAKEDDKGMKAGIKVEKEHEATYNKIKEMCGDSFTMTLDEFAGMIAGDHLTEFPDYYDALAMMEKELKKSGDKEEKAHEKHEKAETPKEEKEEHEKGKEKIEQDEKIVKEEK